MLSDGKIAAKNKTAVDFSNKILLQFIKIDQDIVDLMPLITPSQVSTLKHFDCVIYVK